MTEPVLAVDDLRIAFPSDAGPVEVVKSISFTVGREIVALVGESGSGKSMTGRAIMGLLPSYAKVEAETLSFDGRDLTGLTAGAWNGLRGSGMALILQDPKFSLNPAHRVGRQVEEALLLHTRLSAKERRNRALDMLEKVGLPDPARVYASYPAALSGGMGQRVMIAAMLVNRPKLIEEFGMSLLLISHDLQQVARYADRVLVMRHGQIVDRLAAAALSDAQSSYTRGLWSARPSAATYGTRLPTLDATGVTP
jgi:peptide/nickel transport system ATP-binding protein